MPERRLYDHRIPLEEGKTPPYVSSIYSLSQPELETLRKYIDEHLQRGFLRPSHSPCSAPILFAKKADGSLRLCVDYRALNKVTIKTRYPLPLIAELLDRLRHAKYFTKFDVRDGYNRLRMAEGEEWKTSFICRYGQYEYTVMPFGLCNAPGTFQHYMNDTFREFLDKFLVIYLDDLLIYSETLAEHKLHVRQVLERLQAEGLFLKPSKCVFHVTEVPFLGYIIGKGAIRMDPEKVAAIVSWPVPRSAQEIRMFLGLASFYRRFIRSFSRMTRPLTELLKKNRTFKWHRAADAAFVALRTAFTKAPVLKYFDPALPVVLETDASEFALGAVISQRNLEGELHPVAFYSRKFTQAEENYEIYDKELLAIVDTMDRYRHYFEGLGNRTTIYSDHRNLLTFTEKRIYNRRQVRWAEKLSRFDFVIVFRPGKQSGKPDALSRRPDYMKGGLGSKETTTILKPDQVDVSALVESGELAKDYLEVNAVSVAPMDKDDELGRRIKEAVEKDEEVGPYLKFLRSPNLPRDEETDEYLKPFSFDDDGFLLHRGLVYIPSEPTIKLEILRRSHDSKTAGHFGQVKTLEMVSRDYYWPRMRQYVNLYVNSCDTCSRNKSPRHAKYGPLKPLPVPSTPWNSVSMDFIVELPSSSGYDAILVCVDRLTKMAHFCPTNSTVTAGETARLYLHNVFKHHGLPEDIVSDRGPQFVSKFTQSLLAALDIKGNRSTAYHPQSDGQTERVNQTLEQYLRIFCGYQQDDWSELLPLAEFAYNNAQSASTKMSPFYANYGYHPRYTVKVNSSSLRTNPASAAYAKRLKEIHNQARANLTEAQLYQKQYYDQHVKEAPSLQIGDSVWLLRKNISTTRLSQKLEF